MIATVLPEITLFCGALLILMADVFLAKKFKNIAYASHLLCLIFCAIAILFLPQTLSAPGLSFHGMFINNFFTNFVKAIIIALLTVVILLSLNFIGGIKKISAEFLALLMIAACGGMILISANDFLVFYLAIELQALSLYLLAALNRNSPKSSEAGIKYFILGSVASGILLFGIAMIYGFSGTTNFTALGTLYAQGQATIPLAVMFGLILVITAMFFKISAAPFHMWTPDVYEGAPTIITTFFATVAKFSAVLVLVRLFASLLLGLKGINNVLIFAAILSLAVGSFGAIKQTNIKRLLSYSSIGHVGFVLLGLAALNKEAIKASMFYMVIYAILSLGSFGFLNLIKSASDKEGDEEDEKIFEISALSGLAKTNPTMAFCFAALMFSTAGIPPLAGFFSKFYIIMAAITGGLKIASVIAILFSVIAAYYYLKIVKIMYFDEPKQPHVIKIDNILNIKFVIVAIAIFNIVFMAIMNSLLSLISNFSDF